MTTRLADYFDSEKYRAGYIGRYLNFHVLMSLPPSCVNRDEAGMIKRVRVGNVYRAYFSPAAKNYADKTSEVWPRSFPSDRLEIRSVKIEDMCGYVAEVYPHISKAVINVAVNAGMDGKTSTHWRIGEIEAAMNAVEAVFGEEQVDHRNLADEEIKRYVTPAEDYKQYNGQAPEAESAEGEAQSEEQDSAPKKKKSGKKSAAGDDEDKKASKIKRKIKVRVESALRDIYSGPDRPKSVNMALAGRLCLKGVLKNIPSAAARAQIMMTHELAIAIDPFIASDDTKKSSGAGHLGMVEFCAGVYYMYMAVNIDQFGCNMGLLGNAYPVAAELDPGMFGTIRESRRNVLVHLAPLIYPTILVVPGGRKHSLAAHAAAEYAFLSFSDTPLSMCNAFERPVQAAPGGGYVRPSVDALEHRVVSSAVRYHNSNVDTTGRACLLTLGGPSNLCNPQWLGMTAEHLAASGKDGYNAAYRDVRAYAERVRMLDNLDAAHNWIAGGGM